MIIFLVLALAAALSTAWLLVMPSITASELPRRERYRTIGCVVLAVVVFPLFFYLFLAH